MVFALATITPTLAVLFWSAGQTAPTLALFAATWAVAAVLLLGCASLVAGRPSTTPAWLRQGLLAVALAAACVGLLWCGVVLSSGLQPGIVTLMGDRAHFDAYQYSVAALLAGPILGLLALATPRRGQPQPHSVS